MASAFKIATAVRNAACDAIVNRLDLNTPPAVVKIRAGAPPANVGDASSGTLLGTLNFSNPAFGPAASGVATANAIASDSSADNSGTAGHFRAYQGAAGDTAAEWQGTAGEAADTPDLVFDNKTIVAGGVIAITSMSLTVPVS